MPYNSVVPQGVAGTGNATIYGDNPVAAQFGNQLAQVRKNQYNDELLKQKQAEKAAALMRANQLKISSGALWAPEIAGIEKAVIDEGVALQQKGINPYGTSPEALAFQQKKALAESKQGFRKAHEDAARENEKFIREHLTELAPEDIQKYHDFFNTTTLEDAYNKNLRPPDIGQRYNLDKTLSTLKPVVQQDVNPDGAVLSDRTYLKTAPTQDVILGALQNGSPGDQAKFQEITSGVPVSEIRGLDSTVEGNAAMLRRTYAENVPLREKLARDTGIRPFSPEYEKYIDTHARELARIKQTFDNGISPMVARVASGLKEIDKSTPLPTNLNAENLAERIRHDKAMEARAREREARLAATKGGDAATVRQDLINNIFDGTPGSGEVIKGIFEGSGKYGDAKLHITVEDKPGSYGAGKPADNGRYIKMTIPKHTIPETNNAPARDVEAKTMVFDKTVPADKAKMNQFISELTGENIPYSVLASDKGKKLVAGGKGVPQIKEAGKTQDAGYTNPTQVKDPNGNTITIGVKNGKWYDVKTGKEIK